MRLPIVLLSTFLITACAQPDTRADAPGTDASDGRPCARERPETGSRVPKPTRDCPATGADRT